MFFHITTGRLLIASGSGLLSVVQYIICLISRSFMKITHKRWRKELSSADSAASNLTVNCFLLKKTEFGRGLLFVNHTTCVLLSKRALLCRVQSEYFIAFFSSFGVHLKSSLNILRYFFKCLASCTSCLSAVLDRTQSDPAYVLCSSFRIYRLVLLKKCCNPFRKGFIFLGSSCS